MGGFRVSEAVREGLRAGAKVPDNYLKQFLSEADDKIMRDDVDKFLKDMTE